MGKREVRVKNLMIFLNARDLPNSWDFIAGVKDDEYKLVASFAQAYGLKNLVVDAVYKNYYLNPP